MGKACAAIENRVGSRDNGSIHVLSCQGAMCRVADQPEEFHAREQIWNTD
jgi:hypothetical protein